MASHTSAGPLMTSLGHVTLCAALMALVVFTRLFDDVSTDLGLEHYAEQAYWGKASITGLLPRWLPMPANTLVNVGYVVVGLAWIRRVYRLQQKHETTMDNCNAYLFYAFSWMSVLYGPLQCSRILTQRHEVAVLDQWYTLPIFAWVTVWSASQLRLWNPKWMIGVMVASISTYFLSLICSFGFEVALLMHILAAVYSAIPIYRRSPSVESRSAFLKAIVCCAGFVGLKVLDHRLGLWLPAVFSYLSGHFWSKIADFLQIHYMCEFFLINLQAGTQQQFKKDNHNLLLLNTTKNK